MTFSWIILRSDWAGWAKWDILEIGNAIVAATDIWAQTSRPGPVGAPLTVGTLPHPHTECYTCHKILTRGHEHHAETLRPGWPYKSDPSDPFTGSGIMSSMWWTPLVSLRIIHTTHVNIKLQEGLSVWLVCNSDNWRLSGFCCCHTHDCCSCSYFNVCIIVSNAYC